MTTHLPFAFPIRVPDDVLVAFGEPAAAPSESGYQWKELFLPDGTRLRASFGRKQYFAVVAGADIKYGEHAVSPSCFANLYGSGNRNAWKAVWLRLPGSNEWLLADVCRSARKAAIARLMGGDTDMGGQSSPVVPPANAVQQPAAREPEPRSAEVRPSGAPSAALGNEIQRKKGGGRSARSKRGATKRFAGDSR